MSEHSKENVPSPACSPTAGGPTERKPALTQELLSANARYNRLIVRSYRVPAKFNLLAVSFLWILLAGFVVFPATFPSLLRSSALGSSSSGRLVQRAIQSIPLLVLGIVCFVLGMAGIVWLWHKRQREHLWLMDRLFLPGCLNALAGLIAAVINVYSARGGHWSGLAVATSVLTGSCMLVFALLYAAYSFVILPQVVQAREDAKQEDVPLQQAA